MAAVDHDVVVVGGGLVGAVAAGELAKLGFATALIDRAEPQRVTGKLGFDLRTVALNPASMELLAGVTFEACPFDRVYVWEERGTRHIEFRADEVGRATLGCIAEVSALLTAQWARLRADGRVRVVTGIDLTRVEIEPHQVVLHGGSESFTARLVIAADGAQSAVRRLLGVPTSTLPTEHVALATIVRTERGHEATASQRFLESGPLALLPLPSREGAHFCSIVWSSVASKTNVLASLSDRAFMDALGVASEHRLGRILAVDRRVTFELEQSVVRDVNPAPRALLIGDAAHVLHPLAGQGVNLGFEDVHALGNVAARLVHADLGAPSVWRGFAAERRVRAELSVRAMDAFRRIYAERNPVVRWLRNIGVDVLEHTPFVKTQLIRQALGI